MNDCSKCIRTWFALIANACATLIAIFALSPIIAAAASAPPPGYSSNEIHVKFRPGTPLESPELLLPPDLRNSVTSITRLFSGISPQQLDNMKGSGESRARKRLPDLKLWFRITLKPRTDAADFIERLRRIDIVEVAEFAPLPAPPTATTPDLTGHQGYLEAAPEGIDARYSFTIPGGNGSGVKIYDIEYKTWNQNHEDLTKVHGLQLLVDPGDSGVDPFGDDHGTAVLGMLIADSDSKGITGISWGAEIGLAPAATTLLGYNPAHAIVLAAADAAPGDIILVEQQLAVCGLTDPNYGPPEWSLPVFEAIQTAVANGVVVVETAGNGAVDLDQPACGGLFDRSVRDSGAIIVGAGRFPGSGFDRGRASFSSYGSRVDLQGWGEGVATTGSGLALYNNPDDPTNPNFFYTDNFSGTSAAAPMIAGAAANLQGIALSHFGAPLPPSQIKSLLVDTGSPQLGNTSQHIGPRPDLLRAITQLLGIVTTPETNITSNPPVLSNSSIAIFGFVSDQMGSTFACSLDGGPFVKCRSPKKYSRLGNGSHTFQVKATDSTGQSDPAPASYKWTVDTLRPDTTITSAPPSLTNNSNPRFEFTASDAGSTFQCKLDAGAFESCATPKLYSGLVLGKHLFQVIAIDSAGNMDKRPARHKWTIDTTAPQTAIKTRTPAVTTNQFATFRFSARERRSTFECSLDGGNFSACTSPQTFSSLAVGGHTFQVRARDRAGNVDSTPAIFTWTIQ